MCYYNYMSATNVTMMDRMVARKEQLLRELASDLADQVEAGEITDIEANEWLVRKQDQWFGGDR